MPTRAIGGSSRITLLAQSELPTVAGSRSPIRANIRTPDMSSSSDVHFVRLGSSCRAAGVRHSEFSLAQFREDAGMLRARVNGECLTQPLFSMPCMTENLNIDLRSIQKVTPARTEAHRVTPQPRQEFST